MDYLIGDSSVSGIQLTQRIDSSYKIGPDSFYLLQNGRLVSRSDSLLPGSKVTIVPRVLGGKGGFGSMLRAIGAQIEKTTNREACRDLSGRRLRDINEEKRLKKWIAKQSELDRERERRRMERLERHLTKPKHQFHDPIYDKQRSEMGDKIHDALTQGLTASTSQDGSKRKKLQTQTASKKTKLWIGVDGEDEMSTSGSEDDGSAGPSSRDMVYSGEEDVSSLGNDDSRSAQATESSEAEDTQSAPSMTEPPCFTLSDGEMFSEASGSSIRAKRDTCTEHCPSVSESKTKTVTPPPKENKVFPQLDLSLYGCAADLEVFGLEHLKSELMTRGLKCGGTLQERAVRLFSIKGKSGNEIDPNLLAKRKGK